jgi:hypothetical protein
MIMGIAFGSVVNVPLYKNSGEGFVQHQPHHRWTRLSYMRSPCTSLGASLALGRQPSVQATVPSQHQALTSDNFGDDQLERIQG